MKQVLKILLLEDSETDAEMVQRLLKKEGLQCEFCVVMHKEEFEHALDEFKPDIILSDNDLPQFNATTALEIVNSRTILIPFIMVTGTVNEEFAVNIIKAGADDYILKDRLTRLPAAIYAALEIRKAKKEITDYKFALDQSAIISITDSEGIITYVNENFCRISKYTEKELLGQDHSIINSSYHTKDFIKSFWSTISSGQIWRGECCNKAKDQSIYWVDATIVPFLDSKGKPIQYLSIRNEITVKKQMEKDMITREIQEQKKISRAILVASEKERNYLGVELHDNINQILVGTKIYLGIAATKDKHLAELVKYPLELLDKSMYEIRSLSHKMVTPTIDVMLDDHVKELLTHLNSAGIRTEFDYAVSRIPQELQLNIYRILQQQFNNIIKYAEATLVNVSIKTNGHEIVVIVKDNGKGFDLTKKRNGIGLINIKNRTESFNGRFLVQSSSGNGCKINIIIPL